MAQTVPQAKPGWKTIQVGRLHEFVRRALLRCGVSEVDAGQVADVLTASDLRGVESHGVARLEGFYVDNILSGMIDPKASPTVVRETATSLALDANNGLGHPAGVKAMTRTIEKALESSVCLTTVRNSNHYGIAAYYSMMALEHGLIGISSTNSMRWAAPTFGKIPLNGTSPISVAIPAKDEEPFVLDMATTTVALGKLEIAKRKGEPLRTGWAIDIDGNPTNDPDEGMKGSILPLGGFGTENGGHKGYGLGLLVDILCGVLAGGHFGSQHPAKTEWRKPRDVGHFFGAFRIDGFRALDEFRATMDRELRRFKESKPEEGQTRVYVAGEPEFEKARRHGRDGVTLDPVVCASLESVAKKLEIEPPAWSV
ncbi:MAG: Ldh family oxidoreductase [Candidatus Eremiobacteraeota bacterium]|nr:Ldh family oxidoreductase [Candidatus Eremiobacteraeota bacterium]